MVKHNLKTVNDNNKKRTNEVSFFIKIGVSVFIADLVTFHR
jgi:hypothetical protein